MSFEQLYKTLFADLHRYAFTILQDSEMATDAVQDVFVQIYQKMNDGLVMEHEKSYCYRAVHNKCMTMFKKAQVTNKHEMAWASFSDAPEHVEFLKTTEEQRRAKIALMDQVMEKMPEQCRKIFLKSKVDGLKYREIAVEMGLSIKTIEAQMSKALKIIQEFIRVNGSHLSLVQIGLLYGLLS